IPDRNEKDLDEIPKPLRRKLKWISAANMSDVLKIALMDREKSAGRASRKVAPKKSGRDLKRKVVPSGHRPMRKPHKAPPLPIHP
ncbi:MAG TPA: S16 family serine protease, partial [Acidobacteriota bacterium]|nr:S16 family serine protease [Acidobacteriota bacterium]